MTLDALNDSSGAAKRLATAVRIASRGAVMLVMSQSFGAIATGVMLGALTVLALSRQRRFR
jgi:hypothetical protein